MKEKKLYNKWWVWIILLIIFFIISTIIINKKTESKILDIYMLIKKIDNEAVIYTSAEEDTIIVEIPNYSEIDINSLSEIKNIIKNETKKELHKYKKFIMVSKLKNNDMNIVSVAVYDLPDMKLNMNLSKSYVDKLIDDSNLEDTKPLTVYEEEKGEDIVLTLGTYEVGIDIKPGKYDLIAQSGMGNVITKGSTHNSIMLSINENEYYSTKYNNLTLKKGDIIEIINNLEVLFQSK